MKIAPFSIQITVMEGPKPYRRLTLTGLTAERALGLRLMITELLLLARDATPGSTLLETEIGETTGSAATLERSDDSGKEE